MTFLLVKLARFVSPSEQKALAKDIEALLKPLTTSLRITNDVWKPKNRLFIEVNSIMKNLDHLIQVLLRNPGVSTVVHFSSNLFNWESKSLNDFISKISYFIETNSSDNTFNLDFHTMGNVPFHKKAVLDRLKKKEFIYQRKSPFHLYLELRARRKNLQARIGRKYSLDLKPTNLAVIPHLVLYSPFTAQEIADFFRLGIVFNTSIIFTNENNLVQDLISKVQKSYFKGISKVKFEIFPTISELFSKKPHDHFFGFSLWGNKLIEDLPISIIDTLHNDEFSKIQSSNYYFIFGNENTGLPLSIRYQIPFFRIGSRSSEPLRASQAAAYALGTLILPLRIEKLSAAAIKQNSFTMVKTEEFEQK